ncbi:ImpA family metalloprotease [Parvularcula sp. BGMRC 0090]|uniref:ImpA family metalloprotease n=2 Tax=Parvularcula maris TaxID=2965077 RepID=A0A9X2RJI6_9PROT|nr:ImpA family metalloprotease [Parvularcula maris]MCQ8185881.1 ImpA family metalloprotease [Parvularcula maris]
MDGSRWFRRRSLIALPGATVAALALSACGGGGGSTDREPQAPSPSSPSTPPAPPPASNSAPTISSDGGADRSTVIGSAFSLSFTATDPDGDSLNLTALNMPSFLVLDEAASTIAGTPGDEDTGYYSDITIEVSDGQEKAELVFHLTVLEGGMEAALATGDHRHVTDPADYYAALAAEIEAGKTRFDPLLWPLFGYEENGGSTAGSLNWLVWEPVGPVAALSAGFGAQAPVLLPTAGWRDGHLALGAAGTVGGTKWLALGGNPVRDAALDPSSVNTQFSDFLDNVLSWLTGTDSGSSPSVVTAHLAESFDDPARSSVRNWLDAQLGAKLNTEQSCDGASLVKCIDAGSDLLVISGHVPTSQSAEELAAGVRAAFERGVPVLYFHHEGGLSRGSEAVLRVLGLTHAQDLSETSVQIGGWDPSSLFSTLPDEVAATRDILIDLKAGSYDYDFGACDETRCPNEHPWTTTFNPAVTDLKELFDRLDEHGIDLFTEEGRTYEKLLVLLADHLRSKVEFPISAPSYQIAEFHRGMFADHIHPTVRSLNPKQPDLGTFAEKDLSGVDPVSVTVDRTSYKGFRSTGTYALPGRSFTVTRLDSAEGDAWIRVNSNRSGSVRQFGNDSYTFRWDGYSYYRRPKHVATAKVRLRAGESVTLTTAIGGPVHVYFETEGEKMSFRFEGVGQHPYWRSPEDNAAFAAAIAAEEYDWVEVATQDFEIHGKMNGYYYMPGLMERYDDYMGDWVATYTDYTKLFHRWIYEVGGFEGGLVPGDPQIKAFAEARGLPMRKLDEIEHIYADQASCSSGCGGNPADIDGRFEPTGTIAIHEHGHGVEHYTSLFEGWEFHSQTDLYMHYHQRRQVEVWGDEHAPHTGRSLKYKEMYELLQQARNEADPESFMQDYRIGKSWQESQVVMMQLLSIAANETTIDGGWMALGMMQVMQTAFEEAKEGDDLWYERRAGLGYSGWAREDAAELNMNDRLLVTWSEVLGRDVTAWLEMWGLTFGDTAKAHVASKGYLQQSLVFYAHDNASHRMGLEADALPVDGTTPWPVD